MRERATATRNRLPQAVSSCGDGLSNRHGDDRLFSTRCVPGSQVTDQRVGSPEQAVCLPQHLEHACQQRSLASLGDLSHGGRQQSCRDESSVQG